MTLTVLYEDKRGPVREFGLHRFVTQCVFDVLNGQFHMISRNLDPHPCNGDSKLLEKCRHETDLISTRGCPVVVVFDNDRIRRLLGLNHGVSDDQVIDAILATKSSSSPVCIVLLKENTESVLAAIAQCWPGHNVEVMHDAIDKKDLLARDFMFRAASNAQLRQVRDCVLAANPSVKGLVDGICNLLRAAMLVPAC